MEDTRQKCPKCGEIGGRHIYNEFGEVVYCSEDAPSPAKKYDLAYKDKPKDIQLLSTGQRLQKAIEDSGYSKTRLAKDTGISYQTITRMCSGHRVGTLAAWLIVCETLKISIKDVTE